MTAMAFAGPAGEFTGGVYADFPRPVVWLAGGLDVAAARQLVTITSKVLHDQPQSIVIDLSAVHVVDRLAVTSLISVHHLASAWPGCPVAIAGADTSTRRTLRLMGISRYMPICRDVPAAQRHLSSIPPAPRLRDRLRPTTDAIQTARILARAVCGRWRMSAVEDAAQTVVTELVTNAIQHAGTSIDVAFTNTRTHLHIAVHDRSREQPHRVTGEENSGYGLLLVDAFAATWGCGSTPDGKVVWAAIRLPRETVG
jgi:anti-anti-sigma regulatory factor/anti-sigma regulatory factor (Ser/Thr protein kinase)